METIYYNLILKGLKSIDDVPENLKSKVVLLLENQ